MKFRRWTSLLPVVAFAASCQCGVEPPPIPEPPAPDQEPNPEPDQEPDQEPDPTPDDTAPVIAFASPGAGACVGGVTPIEIQFSDDGSGIDTSSFLVQASGVDVTSAFTVTPAGASAPANALSVADGAVQLVASISDVAGNSADASLGLEFDSIPPTLELDPTDGAVISAVESVAVGATYSDPCGIVLTSLAATFDGEDVTGDVIAGPNSASGQLALTSLGDHTLSISIDDAAGNTATATSTFSTVVVVSSIRVELVDVDPNAFPVATDADVRVSVLNDAGEVVPFVGDIFLTTTAGGTALDGRIITLTEADLGTMTLADAVAFRTEGQEFITAMSLEPAPNDVVGVLAVEVVMDRPVIQPPPPPILPPSGHVDVAGQSFPLIDVVLVVDDIEQERALANEDGAFFFATRIPVGDHRLRVEAIAPVSGTLVASIEYPVFVAEPEVLELVVAPREIVFAKGSDQTLQVTQVLDDGSIRDVTGEAIFNISDDTRVQLEDGRLTAVALGDLEVTVSYEGATVVVPITVTGTTLRFSSPTAGEDSVAVTRETILGFTYPLDDTTVVPATIHADFGGSALAARLHMSPDDRRITLFYDEPLPPSSRIRVTVDGDLIADADGDLIDADGDGEPGGLVQLDFETLSLTLVPGTSVCGRIFASELAIMGQAPVNTPLEGVLITVDGAEDSLFTVTDALGNFRLEPAPAGQFFVHIDGRGATNVVEPGAYYPFVGKPWVAPAGEETTVGTVFLPLVTGGTLQDVSQTDETVITFADDVLADYPDLDGVAITVPAGSLFSDDGATGGQVGIAPVDPDRLPGELPEELAFGLVITVQTDGATNFDDPAPICFPNVNDLPPGAKSALWSFNHDTGEWEVQGSMTVTPDGTLVCTDEGVGISAPGWHGEGCCGTGDGGEEELDDFVDKLIAEAEEDQEKKCETGGSKNCPCDGHCAVGQQVLVHSGEEHFQATDLFIEGRGDIHFELSRTYRSRIRFDGPIGHAWDFNYNDFIVPQQDGSVKRQDGDSHVKEWTLGGVVGQQQEFESPEGSFTEMIRRDDGSYVVRAPDGFKRIYRTDGRLAAHVDRFGNKMQFFYDRRGNLDFVLDVFGREIDFVFDEVAGRDRLVSVKDFAGREVVYSYDTDGNLVEVRSPIVVGTSTGNDFPQGRREQYTYTSGHTEESLNHNLLTVTNGREVDDGGAAWLEISYGEDPSDIETFDKVISEHEGGINYTGVDAGGTRLFAYSEINVDEPEGQLEIPRGMATVTDRRGNVQELFVNERGHHIMTRAYTRGLRPDEPSFYEYRSEYDDDGQLVREIKPLGNTTEYAYQTGSGRLAASNQTEIRYTAGPRGGGDDIVFTFTYEPLNNQRACVTGPRGNAVGYVPPIGVATPERYTACTFFDYQEGNDPIADVEEFGIDLGGFARGLGDLNGDGRTDQVTGQAIRHELPSVELEPDSFEAQRIGSTTQEVIHEFVYNDHGQLLWSVDAEGDTTTYAYFPANDPDGDGVVNASVVAGIDQSPTGWLKEIIVDSAMTSPRRRATNVPTELTTTFGYDIVGNLNMVKDARGVVTRTEFNALREPIEIINGASVDDAIASGKLLVDAPALQIRTRNFFDADGMVVRKEIENRGQTTPGVGLFIEETLQYDILGNVVLSEQEVDAGARLRSEFAYDGDENLVLVTKPEGNQVASTYDERNLLLRTTSGPGTAEEAVTTVTYDENGNRIEVSDAEDNDGDGSSESGTWVFDGFDRVISAIDPNGNHTEFSYDVASLLTSRVTFGRSGAEANARLNAVEFDHDERNRIMHERKELFVSNGTTPNRTPELRDGDDDGWVETTLEYDALDRPTVAIDDDGDVETVIYDGAGRTLTTIDATGNQTDVVYDDVNNIVQTTVFEVDSDGILAPLPLTTHYVYDQLNRLVRATGNGGLTARFGYDNRGNVIFRSDAEGAAISDPLGLFPGDINGTGNTLRRVVDGVGRLTEEIQDLRVGGVGTGDIDVSNPNNADGRVRVRYAWDGNSRLRSITDDNLNVTTYAYDSLDRKISTARPDGTTTTTVWDRDSNPIQITDANGTIIDNEYDSLDRLISVDVSASDGVEGTTRQSFEYDGLSRLVRATDEAPGQTHTILRTYDSLSRMIEESQDGVPTSRVFSGSGNREALVYPSGRRIDYGFDAANRVRTISDGEDAIAAYRWHGESMRLLTRSNGNGTSWTRLDDAGELRFDPSRRPIGERHQAASTFVDRAYSYNRRSMPTSQRRNDAGGLVDRYQYDSINRVIRTTLDDEGNGTVTARAKSVTDYVLDGVHNRRQVTTSFRDAPTDEVVTVVDVNNQIESDQSAVRDHDAQGNLTASDERTFVFDFQHRLLRIENASGEAVASYSYGPLGRRWTKSVYDDTGAVSRSTRFYYDVWEVVEERGDDDDTEATFVLGATMDCVVQIERTADSPDGEQTLYLHQNIRDDVVAITDASGGVIDSFTYDDFGNVESSDGTANGASDFPYLFQGRRFDVESGFYYFRNRYYDATRGRFISRDPMRDPVNRGGGYAFVGHSPLGYRDALGLGTSHVAKSVEKVADAVNDFLSNSGNAEKAGFSTDGKQSEGFEADANGASYAARVGAAVVNVAANRKAEKLMAAHDQARKRAALIGRFAGENQAAQTGTKSARKARKQVQRQVKKGLKQFDGAAGKAFKKHAGKAAKLGKRVAFLGSAIAVGQGVYKAHSLANENERLKRANRVPQGINGAIKDALEKLRERYRCGKKLKVLEDGKVVEKDFTFERYIQRVKRLKDVARQMRNAARESERGRQDAYEASQTLNVVETVMDVVPMGDVGKWIGVNVLAPVFGN